MDPWWLQETLAWSHPGDAMVDSVMGPKLGLGPVGEGEEVPSIREHVCVLYVSVYVLPAWV